MKEKKLNPAWIKGTKKYFLEFLKDTNFPMPFRGGPRGTGYSYPEWMIMFISILAVKSNIKTYIGIHKLSTEYWEYITEEKNFSPISERQLRDRLKKIGHTPRRAPGFIFQIFPEGHFK
jgi:hypothetical protein